MLERFKAVFFDAGGTLFHPYPSVGEIYCEVASRYGCRADAGTIERAFKDIWLRRDGLADLANHCDEKIEKKWWRELVLEVFSRAGEVERFDEFFNELYEIFGRPDVWRLYPGVVSVLKELKKRGKRLGIVSNWDSRLFQLCDGLGLHDYFDFVLASAVFGVAKPGSRIFQEAMRRAGVTCEEAIHVGDSFEDDILGAQTAGLEAILINRHAERLTLHGDRLRGIRVIHDLKELIV
ncbi:MAG: HAD-IA family hydrolase [Candidatus Omnitrophica bacterium]|nr:HAD-IA family hydrolase [Candidatus Omnitrophota bacterium]